MAKKFYGRDRSPSPKQRRERLRSCRGFKPKGKTRFAGETPAITKGNEENEGFPQPGQVGICLCFLGSLCGISTANGHQFLNYFSVDSCLIPGWFSLAREKQRVFQKTGLRATGPKM